MRGGGKRAISRFELGALASSAKHRELMAQHDQLDVLVELAAAAPDEQPQDRSEREVGEREKHPSSLSRAARSSVSSDRAAF
jgi:hypothetical protein